MGMNVQQRIKNLEAKLLPLPEKPAQIEQWARLFALSRYRSDPRGSLTYKLEGHPDPPAGISSGGARRRASWLRQCVSFWESADANPRVPSSTLARYQDDLTRAEEEIVQLEGELAALGGPLSYEGPQDVDRERARELTRRAGGQLTLVDFARWAAENGVDG